MADDFPMASQLQRVDWPPGGSTVAQGLIGKSATVHDVTNRKPPTESCGLSAKSCSISFVVGRSALDGPGRNLEDEVDATAIGRQGPINHRRPADGRNVHTVHPNGERASAANNSSLRRQNQGRRCKQSNRRTGDDVRRVTAASRRCLTDLLPFN